MGIRGSSVSTLYLNAGRAIDGSMDMDDPGPATDLAVFNQLAVGIRRNIELKLFPAPRALDLVIIVHGAVYQLARGFA